MRQIIHNYKLRLTNLSQGNRSLKLSRLSKARDIDLKDLAFIEKHTAESILKNIIAGKDIRLINRLDPRHEPTNLADRRLNRIYRTVNSLFEETGTYDLFVGYPFVEGKFIDDSVARCPVLLFPVRLVRNLQTRPRWKLEIIEDEPIVFNKTFFLAYEQFQQIRLKPEFWEEEIDHSSDWLDWVNQLYQKIKEYEIDVNFNSRLFDLKLETFQDLLAASFQHFRVGKLTFQSQAVLGIFPQSDSSLLQDYIQIEQRSEHFPINHLFALDETIEQKPLPSAAWVSSLTHHLEGGIDGSYIREEDRYFVTPVDQSQEAALLKIKAGKSLVIHGPPGTGKSQVIVNIIADAMAHGKKVLVVSQKRAALDVVYKRLEALGLGRFSVLVHDYRHDRKTIYEKIRRQIDDIPIFQREIADLNVTKWEREYKVVSRQGDQLNREFESLYEALITRQNFGLSVHELYLRQDSSIPPLPLREIARDFNEERLNELLFKIATWLDYAEFFDPEYPWTDRLSFNHYDFDDKDRMVEKLKNLPEQLKKLKKSYQGLAKVLAPQAFALEENKAFIDRYRQINALLFTSPIREDIEAIYKDDLDKNFLKKKFEQLGDILDKMNSLLYLQDFPWRLYEDLKKHVKNYHETHKKTLKFLRLDFLRARWFLKKWLEPKGYELDEKTFKKLRVEFKLFSRLHWHYVRIHEKDFYHDFPLHSPLAEKHKWLDRKEKHYLSWQKVAGLKGHKKLRPVFLFGRLDESRWQEVMVKINALASFNSLLVKTNDLWRVYLHPDQINQLNQSIAEEAFSTFPDQLLQTVETDFDDLKSLDHLLSQLSTVEQKALITLKPFLKEGIDQTVFLNQIKNSFYLFWIEQAERKHPVLVEVSTRSWPRKSREFGKKLTQGRKKVSELIRRRIMEGIISIIEYNRLKNPITYRKIQHQVNKKRRIWSVRKLVQETWDSGLNRLVPCWMASPESVSAIFPMEKDFFDVVVFDEASQCFVERAIPVILRGKQSVIAGDHQQLKPLDLYKVRYDDSEEEFVESELALEVESILDLSKATFEETRLIWHYRSQDEALINFSNYAFYEGRLEVAPPARLNQLNLPPLEWVPVAGLWDKNKNLQEAEKVLELIIKLIQREDNPSIGIVTFNYFQRELIKDLLDAKLEEMAISQDPNYQKLFAAMHKTEQEEFQGIFVKNIENVQGDERDIIIFSIGYAHNVKGKLVTNFGLLNQKGGENRLNVAISRARLKCYLVCSFLPGELNVENARNNGPRYLKSYLHYAKAISDDRQEDAVQLLNRQTEEDITYFADNPIADYIESVLTEQGFIVERNIGETSYKLDIGVKKGENKDEFILGIECEGSFYFSGNSAKEREVYRKELLENRGWEIHRVWARNFWKDAEKELGKILGLLEGDR